MQKDQSRSSLSNTLQNKRKRSGSQDKEFPTTSHINNPIRKYVKQEKDYILQCWFCLNRYKTLSTLRDHLLFDSEKFAYDCKKKNNDHLLPCDICSKKYLYASNLVRHKNNHTRKKQYQCSQCQSCFLRSDYLTNHMKTCRGKDSSSLKKDMKTPQEKDSSSLKKDMKTPQEKGSSSLKKDKEEQFFCNLCPKSYSSQKDLKRHQKNPRHRNECCYCLNLFPNLLDLQNHIELCKTHRNPLKVARVSVIQLATKSQA